MKNAFSIGLMGCLLTSACGMGATTAPSATGATAPRLVCEGPVVIRTEADVRSVGEQCAVIDGDLVIAGTDVKTLDGLEGVHAARSVVVARNPELRNIEGLRGLVTVRGVTVTDNPLLGSLEANGRDAASGLLARAGTF